MTDKSLSAIIVELVAIHGPRDPDDPKLVAEHILGILKADFPKTYKSEVDRIIVEAILARLRDYWRAHNAKVSESALKTDIGKTYPSGWKPSDDKSAEMGERRRTLGAKIWQFRLECGTFLRDATYPQIKAHYEVTVKKGRTMMRNATFFGTVMRKMEAVAATDNNFKLDEMKPTDVWTDEDVMDVYQVSHLEEFELPLPPPNEPYKPTTPKPKFHVVP